jgi:hypothetical protein
MTAVPLLENIAEVAGPELLLILSAGSNAQ